MTKKKKKYPSGGWYQVQKISRIRIEWFGGICMWDDCNVSYNLEFAHAIETELSKRKKSHRSSRERLVDLITNPECFLLFCSEHHRIFDGRTNGETWRTIIEDIEI